MLWSSWLTLSISAGSTAEAWTSWNSIKWVKRSREQSSSCCWDHMLAWCWGWGFVSFKGVSVSLCVRGSAWICRSLFTQPFFKAACLWLPALETGNGRQERLEGKNKRKQFWQNLQAVKYWFTLFWRHAAAWFLHVLQGDPVYQLYQVLPLLLLSQHQQLQHCLLWRSQSFCSATDKNCCGVFLLLSRNRKGPK